MPKSGLTKYQRAAGPWGLPATELERAKTITDPIHGDIHVSRLELRFLDSTPMQRLRRVRQLGTTHLVYPGATHTRFAHSLGALRAAQDILDAVCDDPGSPAGPSSQTLFSQWAAVLDPSDYSRRMAEAIVLARLGALLHDMCHIPFGHTIEDDLGLLHRHDENEGRFQALWDGLDQETRELVPDSLLAELKLLVMSKANEDSTHHQYPFVADIVGNTICADLMDYLRRDHYFTGLPARFGHRLIDGFYVTSEDHSYYPQRLVMKISRDGRVRTDVVSELFKFLRYRYELSERVLVHHAKLAADAMIGKMLDMWSDVIWLDIAKDRHALSTYFPDVSDAKARIGVEARGQIDAEVRDRLESSFLHFGDDGLLQYIAHQKEGAAEEDRRRFAISELANDVLNRRLFKRIGTLSRRESAKDVFDRFSRADQRRRIEQGAARFAQLEHSWYVVLWIPSPDMKLKAAEVLVDGGGTISRLSDRDGARDDRGREIYEAHRALWSISVYVHPTVSRDRLKCDIVLAYIADALGLGRWTEEHRVISLAGLIWEQANAPRKAGPAPVPFDESLYENIAAREGDETFEDYVNRVRRSIDPDEAQTQLDV